MNQNIWKLTGKELHRQRRRAEVTCLLLNANEEDVILDVGCGEGFLTSYLAPNAGLVIGVDTQADAIYAAKREVNAKNVVFMIASIKNLPFRGGSFKKIALLEVLEHLPKNIQRSCIKEVERIIKSKGQLVISVPYKEQISYTRCIHCGKLTPLWGHLHFMDERKVSNMLPSDFALLKKKHVPNLAFISTLKPFEFLPLKVWLILNDILGMIRKGYWVILEFMKS